MADPGPKLDQARQHFMAGRAEQARAIVSRLVQQFPADANVASAMSLILMRLGQQDQALFYSRRAAALRPDDPSYLINLGNALAITARADEALATFQKAAEAMPRRMEPRLGMGNIYRGRGELTRAAEELRAGLEHNPGDPSLSAVYAAVLLNLGRVGESVAVCRGALEHRPGDLQLASMLASASNYDPGMSPEETFAIHKAWGAAVAAGVAARAPERRDRGSRPPRVGLLSHDLRQHSVAYFVEPILRHRGDMEVHCYHTSPEEDAVSDRLRPLASSWRNVANATDAALAERIRGDGIDVLIETAGITQGHRLGTMAMRPAPVQCTFLGYPNTTGVAAMDYRIVDSHTDPPGAERLATERLVRMDPCFLCYAPPPGAPDPGPPPGAATGVVTFGSFNAAPKINDQLLELWARTLGAVPGSRLVLKALDFKDAPLREEMAARLRRAGIERFEVLAPAGGVAEHLALYGGIDIALDTCPYHGTTTTLEAMHMGVPTVTMEGRSHAGRVGVSLLRNVGLGELVAAGPEEYVRIAAGLAGDPGRLAELRRTLRGRLAGSPLCDAAGYAARFRGVVMGMWAG